MATRAVRVFTAAALLLLVAAPAAHAAFPGVNGKIAYQGVQGAEVDIWTMDADGSAQTNITNTAGVTEDEPTWSPDGTRIAFERDGDVYVMLANGSGQTNVTNTPSLAEQDPSWSPDGAKLVFAVTGLREGPAQCGPTDPGGIWTINVDGTGRNRVVCLQPYPTPSTAIYRDPAWAPDGQKIAFADEGRIVVVPAAGGAAIALTDDLGNWFPNWSPNGTKLVFFGWDQDRGTREKVYTIDADGSDRALLMNIYGDEHEPAWSPDGAKIVYWRSSEPFSTDIGLHVVNSDGTGDTDTGIDGYSPDWQPIPIGYPRPESASPLRVSLAVAYEPCTSPNRAHGAPLDSPSCNPPQRTSHLTVGTPDANGEAAKAIGSVRLAWVGELPIDLTNGDQADVKINVSLTDVRNQFDLSDYAGGVGVSATRRITDRYNTPHPGGPGPGTLQDDLFSFTVPCTPTSDKTAGSTCALSTTANTLVPGSVKERQRAMWQLERIAVHDGGPDANPETSPGNRLFMTQGLFIP